MVDFSKLDYDDFKIKIFKNMLGGEKHIMPYLQKLSRDFKVPLEKVEKDYNEYTNGQWEIMKWKNREIY
jgi:hypothetical protein